VRKRTDDVREAAHNLGAIKVFLMTTHGVVPLPSWRKLYQQAIQETDPVRLGPLLDRANDAILDRIEDGDAIHLGDELPRLNEALNNVRLLRRECERCLKRYRQFPDKKAS
jgi:hypothetical protein